MKKIIAAILCIVSFFFLSPPAFAISGTAFSPCAGDNAKITGNIICKIDVENPGGVIGAIISFILFLAVFIAFIFLVIGGLKWITSGGDKAAVESARNTIIAAIIGLVVAFLAYLIINLILGFLGLSFSSLELPKLPGTDPGAASSSSPTNAGARTPAPSGTVILACQGRVEGFCTGNCKWNPPPLGVGSGSCSDK